MEHIIEKMSDDACNPKFKTLFSLVGKRGFDEILSNEPRSFIIKILKEYKNLGYSQDQINLFYERWLLLWHWEGYPKSDHGER